MRTPRAGGPFFRPIEVDTIPASGLDTTIEASAEECAAVAEAIGLPSVSALVAQFAMARRPGDRLKVDGEVRARITQVCVVSLDPFESDVAEPIDVMFAPVAQDESAAHHGTARRSRRAETPKVPARISTASDGEEDPPDPIVDGRIDLGGVAVEFLTLALDFYPRKPGVHFSDVLSGEPGQNPSAFAALERLRGRS